MGILFTLSNFFKIPKEDQMLWLHLFTKKSYVQILINNGLGYILGEFFTNSSGHPACELYRLSSFSEIRRNYFRMIFALPKNNISLTYPADTHLRS
jgi:hypothetical protein